MSSVPLTAPAACWNCRQALQAGAVVCLWCGVAQGQHHVGNPVPAGPPPGAAPTPGTPQSYAPNPIAAGPAAAPAATPGRTAGAQRPARNVTVYGAPVATPGRRVAAFTLDAVAIAVVATAVLLGTGSSSLTVVAIAESIVLLLVLEARTGATLGALLVGQRTTRADAAWSPGLGRSLARGAVVWAGGLVAIAGAWVVVASGAFDAKGRSWSDKISRTVAVTVTRPAKADAVPLATYRAPELQQVGGLATASVRGALPAARNLADDSQALSATGVPAAIAAAYPSDTAEPPAPLVASAPVVATAPGVHLEAPAPYAPASVPEQSTVAPEVSLVQQAPPASAAAPAHVPTTEVAPMATPAVAPVPTPVSTTPAPVAPHAVVPASAPQAPVPVPAPAAPVASALLLVFDTGQRETIVLPASANLGRKPTATEPNDHVFAITDPDGSVSKNHLRVEYLRTAVWVTDLGSTNGTEIVGDDGSVTSVAPGQRSLVEDGSQVRMGNRAFTISVIEGSTGLGGPR